MLLICSFGAGAQNAPVAGFGTSLQFDGTDDYAEIKPYTSPTGDFTIEFWVKPVDLNGGWRGFFGRQPGATTTRGPSMWQNGDLWHCDSYKKDGTRFSVGINGVFKQPDEWVHLAWVKDGGTYYYYRNGKQIHTRTAPPNGDYVTNTELWFGRVDNNYNAFFDEVRIWTVARTVAQINEFRFRNLPQPLPAELLHYYPLDEGAGTTINDIGAAGQNGRLLNGPVFQSAASAPPITTPEDTPVSSFVKGSDANGDVLTFEKATDPLKGAVVFTPSTGAYTYTPNPNATGSDSFTYQIRDDEVPPKVSAPATVNITITAVNDPPVSQPDQYHVAEDGVLTVPAPGIVANDQDVDGDHLSIDTTSQPTTSVANGVLALNQDGSFTYTPNTNFNGVDRFRYQATDGTGFSFSDVEVEIRVDAVNDAPSGSSDGYGVAEDGTLSVAVANGVLSNDLDADGNTLTAQLQSSVANGTLSLAPDGSFSYTPNANFNGSDTFLYVANDGLANSAPITVRIDVRATNDDPTPAPDSYTVAEDGLLSVSAPLGVLANDTDLDGDTLRVDNQSQTVAGVPTQNGELRNFASDGSFTYRPDPNFNGTDSFTYYVTDGALTIGPVTATITVTASNDAPVANNDSFSVSEDGFLQIGAGVSATDLLSNDSDVDGNQLTVSLVTGPTNGGLQLGTKGDFEYRPNANFNGADSFTYRVSDGVANSNTATVNITVASVNDLPVAQGDAYSLQQAGLLSVAVAQGLLANDLDADGNPLLVQLSSSPAHGALQMQIDGSFTYAHDGSNNFTDSFAYRPFDGSDLGNEVTVALTINPVNRAPLAAIDQYVGTQGKVLNVNAANGVLANDLDLDGDQLGALLTTQPTNGALGFQFDGSFSYVPAAGFSGTDSFSYEALDGQVTSGPVTVTLTINAVNTAPLGGDDKYNASSGQVLQVDASNGVLGNDIDLDGQVLSVSRVATQPAQGVLQLNTDGGFQYFPFPSFAGGSDSFTYFVTDGADEAGPVTVTLNYKLTPNQPPVATGDSYVVNQGALLTVPVAQGVLANDTDGDGNTLFAQIESSPSHGQLQASLDGSFTYLHDGSNNFTDSFTYRAGDGSDLSGLTTVNISINAVNHPPLGGTDSYFGIQDVTLQVSAANGVLGNDIDVDGDNLQAIVDSQPSNGALGLNPDGSFSYLPALGFSGLDSFSYRAWDGLELGAPTVVTLAFSAINAPPLGGADSYRATSGQVLQVASINGVLANDIDPENHVLTVTRVGTAPARGTLKLEADGAFVYTPDVSFSGGTDSFTYFVSDGAAEAGPVTVTLDYLLTPNQLPVAIDDSYSVAASGSLTVAAANGVLQNDTDADGNLLIAKLVAQPSQGSVSLASDGSFTFFAPATAGTSTFTYNAFDGAALSATPAVVTVTVIDDMDGVRAGIENSAPNGGDGNGDGVPDSEQSSVTSLPSSNGYLTLQLSGAGCSQVQGVSVTPDPGSDQFRFDFDLLNFTIPCSSASLTVFYHGTDTLAGAVYRKLGPVPPFTGGARFYTLPNVTFGSTSVGGNTVATATFALTDGALGDDTDVDGVIIDAGGPGFRRTGGGGGSTAEPVPTLPLWWLVALSAGLLGLGGSVLKRRLS